MSIGRGEGAGLVIPSAAKDRTDRRLAGLGLKRQERVLSGGRKRLRSSGQHRMR
jgi:hypothetical protein